MNFLKRLHFKQFRFDFFAGITVGIVTIPQGMAFALLAGLPPIYGLYGSFIPLIIYAFFSSSNYLNVGPVSVISIFIFETLSPFVDPFSTAYVNAVVILGLMTGIIQLMFGALALGKYFDYLPKAVISGFIQAAAVVIMLSQLTPALEIHYPEGYGYFSKLAFTMQHPELIHRSSALLFFGSLLTLFVFGRVIPNFPTAIVLLVLTGSLAYLFSFEIIGVQLIGDVPNGLPSLILPTITWDSLSYFPGALGIAFVASIGSYVMTKNVEKHQEYPVHVNQELLALGLSKVVSAFFGALIPAGSFNRSILNMKVGAKTQLSGLIASSIIILTLLFLTEVVYYLPQPVIAALIVYSVYFLFDFPLVKRLIKSDKKEALLLGITFMNTLILGFVYGILIGLMISLASTFMLKRIRS